MTEYVDITPKIFDTEAGRSKVRRAVQKFEDASANVANATTHFLGRYAADIEHALPAEGREELRELRELLSRRQLAQDNFVRTMAE
jgi:hypothetical protein